MCNTSSKKDEGDLSEGLVSHISCLLSVNPCIVMGFIFLFHREEKGINSMKNKYQNKDLFLILSSLMQYGTLYIQQKAKAANEYVGVTARAISCMFNEQRKPLGSDVLRSLINKLYLPFPPIPNFSKEFIAIPQTPGNGAMRYRCVVIDTPLLELICGGIMSCMVLIRLNQLTTRTRNRSRPWFSFLFLISMNQCIFSCTSRKLMAI